MNKPLHIRPGIDERTVIEFEDKTTMLCRVFGAICFPRTFNEATRALEGFALVMARDEKTGIFHECASTAFVSLDPVKNDDGTTLHDGAAQWFNRGWFEWFCRRWFCNEALPVLSRWTGLMDHCRVLAPKPDAEMVQWGDPDQAIAAVQGVFDRGQIELRRSPLADVVMGYARTLPIPAAVHALACGIIGAEQSGMGERGKPVVFKRDDYPYV